MNRRIRAIVVVTSAYSFLLSPVTFRLKLLGPSSLIYAPWATKRSSTAFANSSMVLFFSCSRLLASPTLYHRTEAERFQSGGRCPRQCDAVAVLLLSAAAAVSKTVAGGDSIHRFS